MKQQKAVTRRALLGSAAATLAATILPRHVLGGPGFVAPNDKLNVGYIGCGTQGIRELVRLVADPRVEVTSVCDPNLSSTNYVDWSPNGIRDAIRRALEDPNWGAGLNGIPGGREIGQLVVEGHAARRRGGEFNGCASYADFRELLEKERNLDAVKIMTPDHLHAAIAIASMRRGKHVVTHKPIANRLHEARLTIKTARQSGARTHLLAWSKRSGYDHALNWIRAGAIGRLHRIHNWSNRPVWPQWTAYPTDTPPVPEGFDWPLWLGPVPDRPYHPDFTHAVFRGWYDFGGGAIADMGTYSLWPLFLVFGINSPPVSIETCGTTTAALTQQVSRPLRNEVAFPASSIIRFRFAAQGEWGSLEVCWYDGGMKPLLPDELAAHNQELAAEGMMFEGEGGRILAGFRCERPRLLDEHKMREFAGSLDPPEEEVERGEEHWIEAFLQDRESPGSFHKAEVVTETILLGAVALRAGRRIEYDAAKMEITNLPEANSFLRREYRPGWEL